MQFSKTKRKKEIEKRNRGVGECSKVGIESKKENLLLGFFSFLFSLS